jgi:hypothetical protein
MGVETFMDAAVVGNRKAKRARVLLAAKLGTPAGEVECRLRDLSRKGALVECAVVPPVGTEVVFNRGATSVPARVAWAGSDRVGLEFAYMIDENEVLVQLKRTTTDQNQPRFRRSRLFGEDMSDQEKNLARLWAKSVGIDVPAR